MSPAVNVSSVGHAVPSPSSLRRYNPAVSNAIEEGVITFEVREEDGGGYSAYARVDEYSLCTQGDDLEELRRMIQDLVDDYNQHENAVIEAFALKFTAKHRPVAA